MARLYHTPFQENYRRLQRQQLRVFLAPPPASAGNIGTIRTHFQFASLRVAVQSVYVYIRIPMNVVCESPAFFRVTRPFLTAMYRFVVRIRVELFRFRALRSTSRVSAGFRKLNLWPRLWGYCGSSGAANVLRVGYDFFTTGRAMFSMACSY